MSAEMLPEVLLKRKAIVYVRQSTQTQVQTNLESQRRQYDLVEAPVLPHVILLPDASPAMLPAGLGPMGFESSMNRKTKRSLTPKASEVGLPFSVVNSQRLRSRHPG
jgi:hypothetical protein